ncbi:hypothetical protein BD769DRAFT_1693398 [Suillus cothurnatus]|nr:hypothetical protein BD769DRAFT_1693398 [Suillus cothurnatus]
MSDSVPIRWISRYITQVADKYGMSFLDVAVEAGLPSEKKRIQIIEFLTYNQDVAIWGKVSDEEYVIPISFTLEAQLSFNNSYIGYIIG